MSACEQRCGAPATVYAMSPGAGGWAGRYCEPCAHALRFQITDRLNEGAPVTGTTRPCPHGCGPLRWIEDQWHCPTCGDEWPSLTDVDLVIDPGADETCPACGSEDLSLWAEDGENPRADLWECAACGTRGAVVQPAGAANEDVCPIAFDEGPTFYALRVVRHWNGWAVPAMTRRQVEAVVTWERAALADLSGVDHLDLEGDALYLVDASTGQRHEIERGEDGTYVIDVGWTWEQTDL